ncbi:hypothetical protein VPH35_095933 [Triticum aestivum]
MRGTCRLRRVAKLLDDQRRWDTELLRQYFLPMDVQAILQIKASPQWLVDDVLAWALDPKGIFSVRTAYRLAHDEKCRTSSCATSRAPDGTRVLWEAVWGCPLAQRLWRAMEELWSMPKLEDVQNTGPEWLLQLLLQCKPEERLQVLMTLWRSWHVHNELTHNKPAPPIDASTRFLNSYINTLMCIKQHPHTDMNNGKMAISYHSKQVADRAGSLRSEMPACCWTKPPLGWTKLNVNGSFVDELGTGGAGMVLRSNSGEVIYSSCHYLRSCTSALEAELAACMEGINIARAWSTAPMIVETDCLMVVQMLLESDTNRSPCATYVHEIKRLLGQVGEHVISHVVRSRNTVAHARAHLGQAGQRTAVWFHSTPREIDILCKADRIDPT